MYYPGIHHSDKCADTDADEDQVQDQDTYNYEDCFIYDDEDDDNWNEMFDALIHFGIQHSHCNVPFNYAAETEDDTTLISLGLWLSKQLEMKQSNSLQADRLSKLQVSFS